MKCVLAFLSVLALMVASPAAAWWCPGHMIIAEIALQTVSSDVATKVSKVVDSFYKMGPWPENPDTVQLACWADDIKRNQAGMAGWHFINQPYNPQNIKINASLSPENVVTEINYMYSSMKNHPNNWEETFAVAYMIHLIGDIHQPLHCTTMFDKQFPDGDRGGNLFKVKFDGQESDLHMYWDSICGTTMNRFVRPLNTSAKDHIVSMANKIIATFNNTVSDKEKHVYDPSIMAKESFEAAVNTAYANVTEGSTITQAYHEACIPVAHKRIALAGWRLGNQLQYFFGGKW